MRPLFRKEAGPFAERTVPERSSTVRVGAFYFAVRTPVVSTAVIGNVAIFSMCHET